jgi:nucleotide-binding universal stress UspA family protein
LGGEKIMYDSFKPGRCKLDIGIKFGASTVEGLLIFAKQFADYFQSPVRLTNVVEPAQETPWVSGLPGEAVIASLGWEAMESRRQDGEERLKEIARDFNLKNAEYNVVLGQPSQVLEADAVASSSQLIMVSAAKLNVAQKFLPDGFSTALSLLGSSSVPVVVVPEGVQVFKKAGPLKVLVADDLQDHSLDALHQGISMVHGVGPAELHHVHICEASEKELAGMANKVLDLMNRGDIPIDKNFSIDSFAGRVEENTKANLSKRLGAASLLFADKEDSYHQHVYFGDASEAFSKVVAEIDPDIVIFGRHQLIHRKPWGLGKMPFSAMLSLHKPIMVASPRRESLR